MLITNSVYFFLYEIGSNETRGLCVTGRGESAPRLKGVGAPIGLQLPHGSLDRSQAPQRPGLVFGGGVWDPDGHPG